MHASLRRYQFKPGNMDEIVRRVQEGLVPVFQSMPGFQRYDAIEVEPDHVVSVTVFESREQADQTNQRAREWAGINLSEFFQGSPEAEDGEVRIHA